MAENNTNPNTPQIEAPPTSFIPYTAFNTTLNQSLNPGDYYGMDDGQTCNFQGCVPNVVSTDRLPSITEVAKYNQQSTNSMMNQPITSQSNTSTSNQSGIPQTPATTFDYGATLGSSIQNTLNYGDGITDIQNPYPVTPESLQYLNGFIRTQIGRRVSIDFLVGSNTIVTKLGYLLGVASNYILINELDTNDITTCDFYNIKFIRFFY